MNRQVKSIAVISLVLALVFSVVGCSKESTGEDNANSSNAPGSDSNGNANTDPIKLTVFWGGADPGQMPEEDPIHKYIREKLGVDVEVLYTAGDANQKLNLMLASKDYPDAIALKEGDEMAAYVNSGYIVQLDDYMAKYAPHLKERHDALASGYSRYEKPGMWSVPGGFGYSKENPLIEPMIGIRYDLWKQQGYPKLETLTDLYEFAKKAQDANPTVDGRKAYAFSAWFGDWGFWAYHAMFRLGGVSGWFGPYDFNDNARYTWVPFSKEFIQIAKFLNRAVREGYADPEGAIQNHEQYMQKLNDGRIYVNYYGGDWMDGVANRSRIAAGKPEERIIPYPWLKLDGYDGQPITGQYFPNGAGFHLFITDNAKNPEEIIKRLSWLWTEEGNVLTGMGLEGVHWDYDEEGFRKPKPELIELAKSDPNWQEKTGIGKWRPLLGGYFDGFDSKGDAFNLHENKYYLEGSYDEIDREIFEALHVTNYNDLPKVGMTKVDWWLGGPDQFEPNSPEAMTFQKMNDSVQEYLPKLYLAKSEAEFDKILKEFQDKNIALGYKAIEDIINERIRDSWEKNKDNLDKF